MIKVDYSSIESTVEMLVKQEGMDLGDAVLLILYSSLDKHCEDYFNLNLTEGKIFLNDTPVVLYNCSPVEGLEEYGIFFDESEVRDFKNICILFDNYHYSNNMELQLHTYEDKILSKVFLLTPSLESKLGDIIKNDIPIIKYFPSIERRRAFKNSTPLTTYYRDLISDIKKDIPTFELLANSDIDNTFDKSIYYQALIIANSMMDVPIYSRNYSNRNLNLYGDIITKNLRRNLLYSRIKYMEELVTSGNYYFFNKRVPRDINMWTLIKPLYIQSEVDFYCMPEEDLMIKTGLSKKYIQKKKVSLFDIRAFRYDDKFESQIYSILRVLNSYFDYKVNLNLYYLGRFFIDGVAYVGYPMLDKVYMDYDIHYLVDYGEPIVERRSMSYYNFTENNDIEEAFLEIHPAKLYSHPKFEGYPISNLNFNILNKNLFLNYYFYLGNYDELNSIPVPNNEDYLITLLCCFPVSNINAYGTVNELIRGEAWKDYNNLKLYYNKVTYVEAYINIFGSAGFYISSIHDNIANISKKELLPSDYERNEFND